MRSVAFAALFAFAAGVAAQDLFSSLDQDGDGYLSRAELHAEVARGSGWIAIDRDSDERISPGEFQAVTAPPRPQTLARSTRTQPAQPREEGYSARRLIGTEARDFYGKRVGLVNDILLDPAGAVTGLVVDGERVPWIRVSVAPRATHVTVPHVTASASAGATFPSGETVLQRGEWRASGLLDDVVQLDRGRRYVNVDDLIITPGGEVSAIVVDAGPSGAPPGRYSYAWRRSGSDPDRGLRRLPYVHSHIRDLSPFDYAARGITPP